jgi:nucleotide-binding universal stress UspA family protein
MGYQRILVPVDFSDHAVIAAKLAVMLARRSGGRVTLLHIDRLPQIAARLAEHMPLDVWEAYVADRSEVLERTLADARVDLGGHDWIDTALRRDDIAPAVDRFAREQDVDLIVMGSHGADATGRFLMGSVAAAVAAAAPCPVLATRTQHADRLPTAGAFRRPLIAVDFCPYSEAATVVVHDLVDASATVDLVHAWAPRKSWLLGETSVSEAFARASERVHGELEERLERLATGASLAGLATHTVVERGHSADVLLHHLERGDHDLVLLGARSQRDGGSQGLGSIAQRVLHNSPVPVLLIPSLTGSAG